MRAPLALALVACGIVSASVSLSPKTANIGAAGGSGSVQVIDTDPTDAWTATSSDAWLTITSGSSGTGSGAIQYSVASNPSAASRMATMTVTPASGSAAVLTVTELGGQLSISPASANVSVSGGNGTVTVNTTDPLLEWLAGSNQSWLTVTAGASGTGPGSIQWSASPNSTGNSRSAVISVVPLDGVGVTFSVTQQGSAAPGGISLSPSSVIVAGAGASGSVQLTASSQSLSWTISSNQSWLTTTLGSGTGNGVIQYTASPDPSAAARTATITATPAQGSAVSVTVTQSGGTLTISPTSHNVGTPGELGSISVTTSDNALQWTAVSDQSWAHITSGSSGTGSGTVNWTADANSGSPGRTALITITPAGGMGVVFTLTQQGGSGGSSISVSPSSVSVPASGSSGSLAVTTTTNQGLNWSATSDQSWLTITSGSSGKGNGSIQYSAAATPTAASRTANITVTPADGTQSVTIPFTQLGAVLTINPSSANVSGSGGTGSFTISTNNHTLQWTASSSASWLTITSASSGSGDTTMNWAAAANTSTLSRTATINITPLGGSAVTFTVTQAGLSGALSASPTSLSFSYQQLGSTPAAAQLTVSSSPSGLPFTPSASTTSGGNWLKVTGSGPAPAVLTVSVDPTGLAAGTYAATLTLNSNAATNAPVSISVTLTVTPAPVLVAKPNALTFSFQQNGPVPTSQVVTLTTSSGSIDYTFVPDSSAPWLSASGPGPAPSSVTVSVTPGSLAPGTYQGNVTLLAGAAGNSPFTIPVTLTITSAPNLVPSPASFSLNLRQLDPAPAPTTFNVASSGTALAFTVMSPTAPWLTVSGGGTTPATVQFSVDITSLTPGTYQASIVLTSAQAGNSPLLVPVALTVLPARTLTAVPTQLIFGLTQGTSTPATAPIQISSSPDATFSVSAQTSSGGDWLSVTPSGTQTTPSVLTVSAQAGSLTPGVYLGSIVLTSSQAGNSPLTIPVSLTISALPQLIGVPSQINFTYQLLSGSTSLPSQSLVITASNNAVTPVTASVTTSSGGNWLSVGGSGGSTPAVLDVNADAAGLGVGVYSGLVTLTSPGFAPASVPVTLKITAAPALTVSPASLQFSFQQGGTTPVPQAISVGSSSTSLSFAASPGSSSPWLTITGGGQTPGSASVSVNPAGLAAGTYTGSVAITSPQAANSPVAVPVTLTITAASIISATPSSFNFTYTQQGSVPTAQSLGIGSVQSLSFSTSIVPSVSWLLVTGSGPSPANLQVSIDPTGLVPGQYSASILVNAPGAGNNPLTVPVTLTVKDPPSLIPSLTPVTFSYQISGSLPANQPLIVTSSGDVLSVAASVSTSSGGNWLAVTEGVGTPATFSLGTPAAFSLSVSPSGLSPGVYTGAVTFTAQGAGNSPLAVPVTLVVAAAPVLSASPNQLTLAYQLGGSVPTIAPIQVSSSGSAITFSVGASTDAGGAWLQASSNGGSTTPGLVNLSITPSGLAPGVYTGSISLTSATAANSPLIIPVSLTVTTSIPLMSAPNSLQFSAQQNKPDPSPQTIHISAGSNAIPISVSAAAASWLTVTGPSSTPGDLTVSVSASGLTPGQYAAVILVQSNLAANTPLAIPVTLTVSAAPVLTVTPAVLHFAYTISGTTPPVQTFSVSSSDTPLSYTASVVPGPLWLFASASGTTPGTVQVAVDPGALTAGTYQGSVVVTSPDTSNQATVQVILTVSTAPTILTVPAQLSFNYQVNGPIPQGQPLLESASDGSAIPIAGTVQTLSGGNWLVIAGGGTTPTSFTVTVNPAGLTPGTYHGQITLTSSSASNGPLAVPVTLNVTSAPVLNGVPNILQFSAQAGGQAAPNQQITISSSDGSALQVTAQPSFGITWLTITPSSGTTPAAFTVSANPGSLSPGVYLGSIVFSTPGVSSLIVPVSFTISAGATLVASPSAATFSAAPGAAPPAPITVAVTSSNASVPLAFTTSTSAGTPWLSVTGAGTTPSTITISVNPVGLAPGLYNGSVFISSPNAGNNPLVVPVSLLVNSGNLLTVSPNSLFFSEAVSLVTSQTLQISTTGAPLQISVSSTPSTPWLHVSGGGVTPQTVTVSDDLTGISPGTYQGAVQITAPGAVNSPLLVPVTLVVTGIPSLQANPGTLNFSYNSNNPPPTPEIVTVTLGSQPASGAQATIGPGTPWLSVLGASGNTITIGVNPSGLLAGGYTGSVQITAPGAANSPLTIPVNLSVTGLPTFDVSQDAVALAALPYQGQPVSTTISVGNNTNTPFNISMDVTASTWLSVTPLSGTTPLPVTITADPTGLRPGNYGGSIVISSGGQEKKTIPVNLTIASQPTLSVAPQFLVFNYFQGGDPPAPVNLYFLRFGADFSVTATVSDPWLSVNPTGPTTSGPIQVTVNPAGLSPGTYRGSVSLAAMVAGSTQPSFVKQIPVELYVDQPTDPTIGGVSNGMSFLTTALAPGMVFSIFGTGLGPTTPIGYQVQSDGTISQSLGGVQVLVNGITSPLFYVSSSQINATVPYSLYTKSAATVVVRYKGVASSELPMTVLQSSPGIFTAAENGLGAGAILNQDQSVNTSANPAAKGSIITVFGDGEGQTSPPGIDGLIASTDLSSVPHPLLPVSVSFGGIQATEITYAGGVPTLPAGVFQVNVRIPDTVPSGQVPVLLKVGNIVSQSGVTISVK